MTELDKDVRLRLIKKYGTNPYAAVLLYEEFAAHSLTSVEGFIGFRKAPGMLLVLGEPVCAPEYYRLAMQEFIDFCQRKRTSFIQICCRSSFKEAVKDLDLSTYCIGEDFIFDAPTYSPRGNQARMVRLARNHAIRSGVSVKEYDPRKQPDPALEAAFEALAHRWLKKRTSFTAHLGDLSIFENRDLKRFFYAESAGTPVAMVTCLPIFGQHGYLLEDVIRDPAASYGSIELITLTILDGLKLDGWKMATFGISPRLDATGLKGASRIIAKATMWSADRIFHLPKLYHFRKKFHASHSEPLFALKYPREFKFIDMVRIIAAF